MKVISGYPDARVRGIEHIPGSIRIELRMFDPTCDSTTEATVVVSLGELLYATTEYDQETGHTRVVELRFRAEEDRHKPIFGY